MTAAKSGVVVALVFLAATLVATPAGASLNLAQLKNGGYYKLTATNVTITAYNLNVTCSTSTILSLAVQAGDRSAFAPAGAPGTNVLFTGCNSRWYPVQVAATGSWEIFGYDRIAAGPPEKWNVDVYGEGLSAYIAQIDCHITFTDLYVEGVVNDSDPPAPTNTTLTINDTTAYTGQGPFICPVSGLASVSVTYKITANTKSDFTGATVPVDLY